jgi:hypothetical protein
MKNTFGIVRGEVLKGAMRLALDREIISVVRSEGLWLVEHRGERFGHSREKQVAQAHAHKRARDVQDAGGACQLRVHGEHGFAGV